MLKVLAFTTTANLSLTMDISTDLQSLMRSLKPVVRKPDARLSKGNHETVPFIAPRAGRSGCASKREGRWSRPFADRRAGYRQSDADLGPARRRGTLVPGDG